MEAENSSETLKPTYWSTMNFLYRWCEYFKSCRKYYTDLHVKCHYVNNTTINTAVLKVMLAVRISLCYM